MHANDGAGPIDLMSSPSRSSRPVPAWRSARRRATSRSTTGISLRSASRPRNIRSCPECQARSHRHPCAGERAWHGPLDHEPHRYPTRARRARRRRRRPGDRRSRLMRLTPIGETCLAEAASSGASRNLPSNAPMAQRRRRPQSDPRPAVGHRPALAGLTPRPLPPQECHHALRPDRPALARRGIHYGWVMVAVTFLVALCSAGSLGVLGALLLPVKRDFGWDTSSISAVLAVRILIYGLMGPFAAALMQRYGPAAFRRRGRSGAGRHRQPALDDDDDALGALALFGG